MWRGAVVAYDPIAVGSYAIGCGVECRPLLGRMIFPSGCYDGGHGIDSCVTFAAGIRMRHGIFHIFAKNED